MQAEPPLHPDHSGSSRPAIAESDLSLDNLLVTSTERPRSRSSTTSGLLNLIHNGSVSNIQPNHKNGRLLSLFRLLVLELNLPGPDSSKQQSETHMEEEKRAQELLVNMAKIPVHLEKFIIFGLLVCFNSFLTLFTLVPLKICIIVCRALRDLLRSRDLNVVTSKLRFVKRDMTTLILIVLSVYILGNPSLEVSRLYHDIRGQAHIKLYVMFGVLEMADKLLSSLGQEILTLLFSISVTEISRANTAKYLFFFALALAYLCCHSYVLIYQTVSLHVAANSYSNALLTLLLSNQFAELKSAVFKKFEREGLFQVAMSDLTERFQLSIMLVVIAVRNISQLGSTQIGHIPDSWKSWNKWFGAIFGPTVVVLGSEVFVDWVKHCFINKFNRIRPRIYENFLYVLSHDFMEVFSANSKTLTSHEISDHVLLTRRIGLPVMSLCICFLRMTSRDLLAVFLPSVISTGAVLLSVALISLAFVAALVFRLILSLWLLKWAKRIKHDRDAYQKQLRTASTKEIPVMENKGLLPSLRRQSDGEPLTPVLHLPLSAGSSNILLQTMPNLPKLATGFNSPSNIQNHFLDDSFEFELRNRNNVDLDTEIASSFIPGEPNTESSSINPKTRSYLYDWGESVPPTPEEKRNAQVKKKRMDLPRTSHELDDDLSNVQRYEMASKRIW